MLSRCCNATMKARFSGMLLDFTCALLVLKTVDGICQYLQYEIAITILMLAFAFIMILTFILNSAGATFIYTAFFHVLHGA